MLLDVVLVAATVSVALVTGLLLGFAIVVMPGLAVLDDRAFLRGFQAIDRVIQDRRAAFVALWVGSVVALVAALALGLGGLDGAARIALVVATVVYLVGVQVPTAVINIPLNNQVQALDLDTATTREVAAARTSFEDRWNGGNAIRSWAGVLATALLALVLLWH